MDGAKAGSQKMLVKLLETSEIKLLPNATYKLKKVNKLPEDVFMLSLGPLVSENMSQILVQGHPGTGRRKKDRHGLKKNRSYLDKIVR